MISRQEFLKITSRCTKKTNLFISLGYLTPIKRDIRIYFPEHEVSSFSMQEIINRSLMCIEDSPYLEEMEIGHCTSAEKDCESRYCKQGCSKWRITPEQLKTHMEKILEIRRDITNRLNNRITVLNRIYSNMEINYDGTFSTKDNEDLKRQAKLINGDINDLSILNANIIRASGDKENE